MHVGKERPRPSRDQSPKTHLVTGPRSTQRRQSGQGADWLRPRSSLRTYHEPAQTLWTESGKVGFPMMSGRCGWKQGCRGTDDEDAHGSPAKWGQPPGCPSGHQGLSLRQPCCRASHPFPWPGVLVLQKPPQGPLPSSVTVTTSAIFVWHPPYARHMPAPVHVSRDPCPYLNVET